MHAGGPGRLPLVNLSWTDIWNDLLARASSVVGLDPGVLWPALAILLIVLAWAPARRWGRTLVTTFEARFSRSFQVSVQLRFTSGSLPGPPACAAGRGSRCQPTAL